MKKSPKNRISPRIRFNGPPELKQAWDRLRMPGEDLQYAGLSPATALEANLLNELVFEGTHIAHIGDKEDGEDLEISGRNIAEFLKAHQADPKNLKDLPKDSKEPEDPEETRKRRNYYELKERIEHIAHVSSALAWDKDNKNERKLNRTIIAPLIRQWIALEDANKLYPPVPIAVQDGVTYDEKEEVIKQRHALRHTVKGGFLSATLQIAVDSIIGAQSVKAFERHKNIKHYNTFDFEDIKEVAEELFERSLFAYELGHNASFPTFVYGNLEENLGSAIQTELRRRFGDAGLIFLGTQSREEQKNLHHSLKDRTERSQDIAISREGYTSLHEQVKKLNRRYGEIIDLRYGLSNGVGLDLEKIGERLGISKERVRQIEGKALEKLHRNMEGALLGQENGPAFASRLARKREQIPEVLRAQRKKLHDFFTDATGRLLDIPEIYERAALSASAVTSVLWTDSVVYPRSGKSGLSDGIRKGLCGLLKELGKSDEVIIAFEVEFERMRDLVGYKRKPEAPQKDAAQLERFR